MNFSSLLKVSFLAAIWGGVNSVEVVCYYESWQAYDAIYPEDLDATLCTVINYAYITIWDDGNLRVVDDSLDIDQGLYQRVSDMKTRNSDLTAILSVNGNPETYREITSDVEKIEAFVGSASYFITTYGYDGLDIWWEYPESEDRENYITLLRDLRETFDTNGWLLTATVASNGAEHSYDYDQMRSLLDWINVMTYDFYGPLSNYTGQNSALYASSVETDWEKANLNVAAAANNWADVGIPKSKLNIGVAFYGRTFGLQNEDDYGIHAPITGVGTNLGYAEYWMICSQYSGWTRVWDDEQKNPYLHSGYQWIGYDDQDSIYAKAAWIKDNGFRGVMIWAIDSDDYSGQCGEAQLLLKQINRAIE